MQKITQQDLDRAEKRKVIDLWVIWGTEKLYSQNVKTQLEKIADIKDVWEDQDPVTWLKATDTTDDNTTLLTKEELEATKDNPVDLGKDDGFVGYEVEHNGTKVQIAVSVINELKEVKWKEFDGKTDSDIIEYMIENKHSPFND